jgi:hypothetical protein
MEPAVNPPVVPILNQLNPVHACLSYIYKIHFITISSSSHLCLDLPSGLFLLGFPIKPCMNVSSPHACYESCPARVTCLVLIVSIIFAKSIVIVPYRAISRAISCNI